MTGSTEPPYFHPHHTKIRRLKTLLKHLWSHYIFCNTTLFLWQFCNTLHSSLLVRCPQKLRNILLQLPESTDENLVLALLFTKLARVYPIENVNVN